MLLDYALLTAPTPLQAGTPATLTLAISNGGRHLVTVTSIVITLPLGANAKDLTASTSFETGTSSGWSIAQNGGLLTLTPTGNGTVGATPIVVTIANLAVNGQPGTTHISIDETAAVGGGAPVLSSTSLSVGKFPTQFSLSDLVATPTEVAFGGSASVMWSGTQADQASYTLDFPGAPQHPINVTNVGPYQANNLTIFPAVFTLKVSLTVPGQDAPAAVQKQATVVQAPELKIVTFAGSRQAVGGADTFDLNWEVQLATSLTLEMPLIPGSSIDVSGLFGCTIAEQNKVLIVSDRSGRQLGTFTPPSPFPRQLPFVLTASDGNSFVQSPAVSVEVLAPAITTFDVTSQGNPGYYYVVWSVIDAIAPVVIEPQIGTIYLLSTVPDESYGVGNISPGTVFKLTAAGHAGLITTRDATAP
jgi:hypothetical protein